MIRLILRRPAQLCGEATGLRTNYENLYLMDEIYADQVSSSLPLGEVSTITYANQQDGFLFGEMSAHVKAEFGVLLEFNCRQEQHREQSPLGSKGTEECPHMDGYTVGLEEGWFLTYAGELMYHYSCRPIIVVGRDDASCYSALPIDLVVEDQKRLSKAMRIQTERRASRLTPGLFLGTPHEEADLLGDAHALRPELWRRLLEYLGRLGHGPSSSFADGETPDTKAA
jgi:hypothetical protein